MTTMRAWAVARPGPIANQPMHPIQREVPQPGPDEVLVSVRACGRAAPTGTWPRAT